MEERIAIRVQEWEGLNSRDSDLAIRPGQATSLQNVEFYRDGWRTRNGYSKKNSTSLGAVAITGLFDGWNDVLAYHGTTLGEWNGTTFADINTGLTSGAVPRFTSYNALDLMVNGNANDNPKKWDGTTFADLGGSPPKADDICVWRNHVWLSGLASPNQGEVRYSKIEDPETWDSGGFLRPSKRSKGHDIIAAQPLPYPGEEDGTRLVVFGSDAIFHFDGFTKSLFQVYTIKPRIGCISARSIVSAEDFGYWVDEDGIYCSPDGGQTINQISWDIQPTFEALNKSRLNLCAGVHLRYKRQIYWSFSDTTSAYHNKLLVYNYGLSTPMTPSQQGGRHVWSVYTGINLMAMTEVLSSNQFTVWGGEANSATGGFVYQLDSGTSDAGTAISWKLKTKRFLLGDSWSVYSVLRKLTAVHDSLNGTMSVRLFVNAGSASVESQTLSLTGGGGVFGQAVFGTDVWGGASAIPNEAWYNRVVRAVQFEFSGSDLDKLIRFYEITIEAIAKRGSR